MAQVAFQPDDIAGFAEVLAVVAAEAARRLVVAYVVRVRVLGQQLLGEVALRVEPADDRAIASSTDAWLSA